MILSIIIVNWNTRELLQECLSSVFFEIEGTASEVLVVDNASTDGSVEMVEADFAEAIVVRNKENRGFAAANNQAIAMAKGRYVLLLNSDTVVRSGVLARSVAYMDLNPSVGIMGCRVLNSDGSMQSTCSRFPTILNLLLLTSGLWRLPWPAFFDRYQMRRWARTDERDVEVVSGCYLMARSDAIKQVGLLDEDFFFFGEETDWCRRFSIAGWQLKFAPVGEIVHHGGGSSRGLNYKRDLLLSNALVKLHKKHYGIASAAIVWLILLTFNSSRAIYWTVRTLLGLSRDKESRRDHFISVVKGFRGAWSSVDVD